MNIRVFSNGPGKDFVMKPFEKLAFSSSALYLAAPYFTLYEPVVNAARAGKKIQLLVGLNPSTSPEALSAVHDVPNLAVRYFTRRFHAKIYLFDDAALLGSSNLTDGGMLSNREATIFIDRESDLNALNEIRSLFVELWESGCVLTGEKLKNFKKCHGIIKSSEIDADSHIEEAVGRAEPQNVSVESRIKNKERAYLENLRRVIYEQYRPAFREVTRVLLENGFRRPELIDIGVENETNRYLNYVRLAHAVGDEAWRSAPLRSEEERLSVIVSLGREWVNADDSKVPTDYVDWIENVRSVFRSQEAIAAASRDQIMQGLLSLHAFVEQLRFVKGGLKSPPKAFWDGNDNYIDKARRVLSYLLFGPGDFVERLHDLMYRRDMRLAYFGQFCALELYGTICPNEYPPVNGRMAKALRYIGFDVPGA